MYRNNDINEYLPENAERKLVKQPVPPRGTVAQKGHSLSTFLLFLLFCTLRLTLRLAT